VACTLPTPELSWTYDMFTVTGSGSSAGQQAIFAIKNMLKTTFGWTIAGSSDAVTGDMDGVDRWIDLGDIVSSSSGSGARSWIVMQSPGGQQILWEDRRIQGSSLLAHYTVYLYWSPLSDFSGGSNTAIPTSPNRSTIISAGGFLTSNYSGSAQSVVHIMQSTDNLHTRLFTFRGGAPYAKWFVDTLLDPVTGFAIPQVSWINRRLGSFLSQGADVNAANYATMHNAEQGLMRVTDGGVLMSCSLACEGTVSDSVGERITIANELDACNPILPTVVVSGTAGASGVIGRIPDVWFGRANVVNGTTYPGTGTHLFAQFSDVIVPWDGTLPQVT